MASLHLIREKDPDPLDLRTVRGRVHRTFCPSCNGDVYVIHIDAPPVDPTKRIGIP